MQRVPVGEALLLLQEQMRNGKMRSGKGIGLLR